MLSRISIHPTLALLKSHEVSAHRASFARLGLGLRPPAILSASRHESSSSESIESSAARFRSRKNCPPVRFRPVGAAFSLGGSARGAAARLFQRPSPGRATGALPANLHHAVI